MDVSFNKLVQLPLEISSLLKNLNSLVATDNLLDSVPVELAMLENLNVSNNPLLSIYPAFRSDMNKVRTGQHYVYAEVGDNNIINSLYSFDSFCYSMLVNWLRGSKLSS